MYPTEYKGRLMRIQTKYSSAVGGRSKSENYGLRYRWEMHGENEPVPCFEISVSIV